MSSDRSHADGPFAAHLGFWLRFVSNHVSSSFRQKLEQQGVAVAEWACLRELFAGDGLAPSALATLMGMTRGGITKIIDKLVARGLVIRSANIGDQRAQLVRLTPAGRRLVPKLTALAENNEAEFFGHLPQESVQLMSRFLRDLVEHHQLRTPPLS